MVIIILNNINKLLWGIATIMLLGSGLYYSKKLKFIQFNIKELFKGFTKNKKDEISPFKTLMFTLAGRIGVGCLAGIALAIYVGGPGTIFWLWISTFIVVPNAYVESFLGVLFHKKKDNINEGGPSYYIKKGLKAPRLAKIYALLVLITYLFGFLTIQANTITKSLIKFNFPELFIGILIAIITGLIIFKGTKGIIDISSKMMPIIGIIYILISFYIIIMNINNIGNVFLTIIKDAFKLKAIGTSFLTTFVIGFQRGIFSNEAGIGSGAIASSTASSEDAKGQGMVQIMGVYFTSLILCTLTAIIILLSNYQSVIFNNVNGIELTQYAFTYHLGYLGEIILLITIFIFAFSTILTGYYYGENSLKFLFPNISKKAIILLKIISLFILILGSVTNSLILWGLVDIFIALMGIINVYSIVKLKDYVL